MERDEGERPAGGAEAAYEAMAPVYDAFTAHHDYDAWLGALLPKLEKHGVPPGHRLLDVGCGTGKSFIPMLERGWQVTACDLSPAMVAIAREKVGDRADVSVADMRDLPRFGEFDLVWCLDDAVNYLLSGEELVQALSGMQRNLASDGLLMFDLNTLESYRTFFAEEAVLEGDGRRMTWKGRTDPEAPPGSIAEATLEVESLDEAAAEVRPSLHRERHFPEAEVREALGRAGLECLDVYGHHHDGIPRQPLDEAAHTKAIYVARRAK